MPQVSLEQAWIAQELPQICDHCCCPYFYWGEPRLTFGQFQNSGLEICAVGASPTRGGKNSLLLMVHVIFQKDFLCVILLCH